jgi:hypothetical protein
MSGLLLHGKPQNLVRFDARVVDVIRRRGENDTVFRIVSNATGREFTCTSSFHIPIQEGDNVVGGGVLETKEDYRGRPETFVRVTAMPIVQANNSKEGLLRSFLMKLKGCSSLKARELYQWIEERLAKAAEPGADAVPEAPTSVAAWLDEEAERYCREGFAGTERALQTTFPSLEIGRFLKWWHNYSSVRRLYLLGLSPKEVKKIYLSYDKAYAILLENPYLLINLPLETCERVLKITKVTLPATARRCGEIARVLLSHVQERQWSCTPLRVLYSEVADAGQHMAELQRSLFPARDADGNASPRGYGCVVEYQCIYLHYQHEAEQGFAEQLRVRARPIEAPGAYFHPDGRQPSDDQREAVELGLHQGVSCNPGEGGSGKTTMITFYGENFDLQSKKWVVLSFTGKAVSRVKDVIKRENVYTIHRVLTKELPGVTVAMIDEASMVETPLLYRFLKNHPNITHLIFLGDPRQLLPIAWGSLFTQILQAPLPIIRLRTQHRQRIDGEDDYLYSNLQHILHREPVVAGPNFSLQEGGLGEVLKIANEIHDQGKEVVVLAPVNRVIEELNRLLRDIVNADAPRVVEPKSKREWRLHDRVMCTENCYDINVMNGEEGKVVDLDDQWIEVRFRSGKYRIPFDARPDWPQEEEDEMEVPVSTKILVLAYALTFHKSQGSEYPEVIVYVPEGVYASGFFCNNMTYVAPGRAKEKCHVVGNIKEFQAAIRHDCHYRYENLARRLQDILVPEGAQPEA